MKNPRVILFLAALAPLTLAYIAAMQTLPAAAATPAVAASVGMMKMGRQLGARAIVLRVQPQIGALKMRGRARAGLAEALAAMISARANVLYVTKSLLRRRDNPHCFCARQSL